MVARIYILIESVMYSVIFATLLSYGFWKMFNSKYVSFIVYCVFVLVCLIFVFEFLFITKQDENKLTFTRADIQWLIFQHQLNKEIEDEKYFI